jgi:hypothetical protein
MSGPIAAACRLPCSQALRSRVLTSGASQRGLVPTNNTASAVSNPVIVEFSK